MPANVGNQTVSIIYFASATSGNVNKRHKAIRQLGIYQGGTLGIVQAAAPSSVSLSPLVCEITDGTHQVRAETTSVVNIAVAPGTPFIVLRWTYVGATSDYMEILAVLSPASNDLVVGKCNFVATVLQGFDYADTSYPRSTPNTQDLFLKVEPTEDTELRVRIRAGAVQNAEKTLTVVHQKSDLFVLPGSNSKVFLVYIDTSNGNIEIDSSGTEAVSPVAPSYRGKMVLAEVTLASTDTNITADKIKDVRSFLSVKKSDNVYAGMYNSGQQVVPTQGPSGKTKLQYNTSIVDSTGNIVDLANNWLKPDVAGWYRVHLSAGLVDVRKGDAGMQLYVYKNGTFGAGVNVTWPYATANPDPTANVIVPLLYFNGTTDYIEAYIRHGSGVNLNTYPGYPYSLCLEKVSD